MFLKLIECRVPSEKRIEFSRSQECWKPIARCPGFVAQCGGMLDTRAVILGFWEEEALHQKFMDEVHDKIFSSTKQAGTFDSLCVSFWGAELVAPKLRQQISRSGWFQLDQTGDNWKSCSSGGIGLSIRFSVTAMDSSSIKIEDAWTVIA